MSCIVFEKLPLVVVALLSLAQSGLVISGVCPTGQGWWTTDPFFTVRCRVVTVVAVPAALSRANGSYRDHSATRFLSILVIVIG